VADGATGLSYFRDKSAAVDLVVLDLLMPGLSGEETLIQLRAIRADVPVLLISGYSEGDILRRLGSSRAPLAFLSKPFSRSALEDKLREMLR